MLVNRMALRFLRRTAIPIAILLASGCSGPEAERRTLLTAELPLHLEEHVDAANIVGSEVPEETPEIVEWRFNKQQPDWQPADPINPDIKPVSVSRTDDALRLSLEEAGRTHQGNLFGAIYAELPNWNRDDWSYVLVKARTSDKIGAIGIGFNLRDDSDSEPGPGTVSRYRGDFLNVISDGSEQTYLLRTGWSWGLWRGPWKQLIIWIEAAEPAGIDILSVSVIPNEANYANDPVGVRMESRGEAYRRTVFTHTPGRIEYNVMVPEDGRLDVGLGVLRNDTPVLFRITAQPDGGEVETLLQETYSDKEKWAQRTLDLSALAGQAVMLTLSADAEGDGAVALWAAPTLSGARATHKPNVIFYIIDGAGADYISAYGYNRRTTPNLEILAAEGAVFEYAYSNSTWSKTSTPSFMTSLQHSVLGGYKTDSDPLPDQAVTMAQYMHRAGYQTAVFTTNAYCGTMSSLERGVDTLRQAESDLNAKSSEELHKDFWKWRTEYPGEPYWVHFQTTDVHWPFKPQAPFAGLFISSDLREKYYEWEKQLAAAAGLPGPTWPGMYPQKAYEDTGISRVAFNSAVRDLYDEMMAQNDYQVGKLVERLKASGEWEHTLFIVAADHGSDHGDRLLNEWPRWRPLLNSFLTRIPLIVVWPERIAPGQRFKDPVSMIDMLPTILELAELPVPSVTQGRSLAPLLLGSTDWEPHYVFLDEFYYDRESGELSGTLEIIDGRWGAELMVNPPPRWFEGPPGRRAPGPLPLYDLWSDPYCLHSIHEERPDLVEKYEKILKKTWREFRELAGHFTRSEQSVLDAEQLRALRNLGYIQ